MKAGDMVVITKAEEGFFEVGDKAKLVREGQDGVWYADFTCNKKFRINGQWCIQLGLSECELDT